MSGDISEVGPYNLSGVERCVITESVLVKTSSFSTTI